MLTSADLVDDDDDEDDDENDEKREDGMSNEKPVNPERLKAFNVCFFLSFIITFYLESPCIIFYNENFFLHQKHNQLVKF